MPAVAWFGFIILMVGVALWAQKGQAMVTEPEPAREPIRFGARTLTVYEREYIVNQSSAFGVDPLFMIALALIENGPAVPSLEGPTRGLGVLPRRDYPTFEDQVTGACRTVSNTIQRWADNTGDSAIGMGGRYTPAFIRYLSQGGPGYAGYAPVGASNDPTGLNVNHYRNLQSAYAQVQAELA